MKEKRKEKKRKKRGFELNEFNLERKRNSN